MSEIDRLRAMIVMGRDGECTSLGRLIERDPAFIGTVRGLSEGVLFDLEAEQEARMTASVLLALFDILTEHKSARH